MILRLTTLIVFGLLVGGCTFSAPQFEAGIRLIESVASVKSEPAEEPQATWLASVGDQGAVLSPYSVSGLTVFANVDGDAIAFDGWTIRSITGFGLSKPVSVTGRDGVRIFVYSGSKTTTIRSICVPVFSSLIQMTPLAIKSMRISRPNIH